MPRMGEIILPNYPYDVVQSGHNRQVVFADEQDYQRYIADLRELKDVFGIEVYAYCLMPRASSHLATRLKGVVSDTWNSCAKLFHQARLI